MLCNVYSVSDEKRMYTKIGIKEMVERIARGELRVGVEGGFSFTETVWEVLEEGCEKEEIFEDAI